MASGAALSRQERILVHLLRYQPVEQVKTASREQTQEGIASALEKTVDGLRLNDRAADIWRPILAVAEVVGIPPNDLSDLTTLAREMGGDPDALDDAHRLAVVRVLRRLATTGRAVGTTTDLCEMLRLAGVEGVNVHELLSEWGFTQRSVRIHGRGPRRAWDLADHTLAVVERELEAGCAPSAPLFPSTE